MIKRTDTEALKKMLSSQGINYSTQEIELMKNSLNPEMMKMMRSSNLGPRPGMSQGSAVPPSTQGSASQPASEPPKMPNLGNMDLNSMLQFVKSNPEIMKMVSPQLAQMFGGKEADPELMMKTLDKIQWIINIPTRIKKFFTSWRGIAIILLIIALIIGFIYR